MSLLTAALISGGICALIIVCTVLVIRRLFWQGEATVQLDKWDSRITPSTGFLAIILDISGSISPVLLEKFEAGLRRIAKSKRGIFLITCDTECRSAMFFREGDDLTVNYYSRGGTDFQPAFDRLSDLQYPATEVVCFTDGYLEKPDTYGYKVTWAIMEPGISAQQVQELKQEDHRILRVA